MSRWLDSTYGPRRGRGTAMDAWTPPLMNVTWLIVHSMMSCPASVAIARYKPLMRSDGIPTIAPMSAAMSPPAMRLTGHGESRRVARFAAVYAPTDMNAPWPMDTCPVYPTRMLRPSAPMTAIHTRLATERKYSWSVSGMMPTNTTASAATVHLAIGSG